MNRIRHIRPPPPRQRPGRPGRGPAGLQRRGPRRVRHPRAAGKWPGRAGVSAAPGAHPRRRRHARLADHPHRSRGRGPRRRRSRAPRPGPGRPAAPDRTQRLTGPGTHRPAAGQPTTPPAGRHDPAIPFPAGTGTTRTGAATGISHVQPEHHAHHLPRTPVPHASTAPVPPFGAGKPPAPPGKDRRYPAVTDRARTTRSVPTPVQAGPRPPARGKRSVASRRRNDRRIRSLSVMLM